MSDAKQMKQCAVILAGGRGTRFWPRSRMRTPKQLLDIVSTRSMLHETAARLAPLFPANRLWVVTNAEQAGGVRRELPRVPRSQILLEPAGRNTAAAIGLAAIHLTKRYGDAVMAVLPADHHIGRATAYRRIVRAALAIAGQPGNLVVLGIPPTRADTGFGYIERGLHASIRGNARAFTVKRFAEKPTTSVAQQYVASGKYLWNAGMFFWRASTFLECLQEFLPRTAKLLSELQQSIGGRLYSDALARIYPRLENISVDYAVMEPVCRGRSAKRAFVVPAEVGWSDIGSWDAVYELLAPRKGENVSANGCFTLDAAGNYLWNPKKFTAAIGVHDLIVVNTADALLICPRGRAQDVGKIVKWLEGRHRKDLL